MKYTISMRKARILLILGTWVTMLPYLGFLSSWKDVLFTLTGLGLIYFSYLLYKDYKKKEYKEKTSDNFRENSDFGNKENEENETETIIEESEEYIKLDREEI